MFDTVIRSGAVVDRAILDKEVVVGQGAHRGRRARTSTRRTSRSRAGSTPGITVVGKQSVDPARAPGSAAT